MADICQLFLLCVITVESSAFKLLRDVWLTSILAISGEWVKIWGILSKKGENKKRQKVTKIARFVEEKLILWYKLNMNRRIEKR
ncbi:MAG: hypothetical protein IKT41_02105 [Clostridia bacterium]|nr:hypothetical protein [Clostridia bacterium]